MSSHDTLDSLVRPGKDGVGNFYIFSTVEDNRRGELSVRGGKESVGLAEDRTVDTEGVGVVLVSREVSTLGYCNSELEPFYLLFFFLGVNRISVKRNLVIDLTYLFDLFSSSRIPNEL